MALEATACLGRHPARRGGAGWCDECVWGSILL